MFGVLLAGVSAVFDEIAASIGKKKITEGLESYYTFGFLTQFLSALLITAIGFAFSGFFLSVDSFPTLVPRVLVAMLQMQLMVVALSKVERGTFGFIRLATIPLLLGADLFLGYPLKSAQMVGMTLIVGSIATLFYFEFSKSKGMLLTLIVSALAAVDLSLYKYDITHFNSVETEQAITSLVLSLYFFLTAVLVGRENPIAFLREKIYMTQALSSSIAYVVNSFAYLYAPASVITTAFRAFSVLFAVLSGTFYFRETGLFLRALLFVVIALGLALLV